MMIFLAYFKEKNHFQFRQVGFVLNNHTWDIGYNEFSNNIHESYILILYLVVLSIRKYECRYENSIFYHLYKP